MSLVIDMKTRAVLHSSEDDKEEPAPVTLPPACDLRLVAVEPDRLEVWRKWVPGLLHDDEDSGTDGEE